MSKIKLENGWYLEPASKDGLPLTILTQYAGFTNFDMIKFGELNYKFDGDPYRLYGDFFVSKKGTKCFRVLPEADAKHQFIKITWRHGKFSPTDGLVDELVMKDTLYHHRVSSRGGGAGVTYLVLPKEWKYKITEEDI